MRIKKAPHSFFGFLSLFAALTLTSCFGRPHFKNQSLPISILGLQAGKPAVIAFSALWCHPCREEIETLNQGNREFGSQVQIVGYIVEGEEKGSPVQLSDLRNFKSFSGSPPEFPVRMDEGWKIFDSSRAPEGRALPTLMVIDHNGQTLEIVQQSLDYQSQLRPILQALAQGQAIVDPNPIPIPNPTLTQMTDSVQNWLARSEVVANPNFLANLTASWQSGLMQFTIEAADMPIGDGQIKFGWDGNLLNVPQSANWYEVTATSICKMILTLNPDATLIKASGSCKPK